MSQPQTNSASYLPDESELRRVTMLSEKILGMAEEYSCPLYPKSYELLYEYCEGTNPKVQKAVRSIVSTDQRLTIQEVERLHNELLYGQDALNGIQLNAVESLSGEIGNIANLVENYLSVSSDYSNKLSGTTEELSNFNGDENLARMINGLIKENETMRNQASSLSESLEDSREKISDLQIKLNVAVEDSMKDALTGLGNRRWLERDMSKVMEQEDFAERTHCFVLIDLDYFKRINDDFGYLIGDKVLQFMGQLINKNIKGSDTAARYGGEEFAVLLQDCDLQNAEKLMNTIRKKLETSKMMLSSSKKHLGSVTASFGVTQIHMNEDADSIMERADSFLYKAKANGRNQVVSG